MENKKFSTENFVKFLQKTRTQQYYDFIYPTQKILENTTLTIEEKITKINQINKTFKDIQSKWDLEGMIYSYNVSQ